jgi:8-oxo-dGTP diphosphatase
VPRLYCIRCAHRLARARERGQAVSRCPACGWTDWFNPAPTASVLIVRRDGKGGTPVLLVRRAFAPARGAWDVPGGFVERGETAEAAAVREAREELGVEVHLERVVGIFPDTYFFGGERQPSLNIYYLAQLRRPSASIRPADDVSGFRWFPLARLPRRLAFKNNRTALRALGRMMRRGANRPTGKN